MGVNLLSLTVNSLNVDSNITQQLVNDSFSKGRVFWSYGQQVPPEAWSFTIKQTIITLLCAFGIFSNFFIIIVIMCVPSMRTYKTSIFISSLATADMLVCSVVMTINSILQLNVTRLSDSQQHKVACHLWSSMTVIVCSSSSFNVCVISLDRYFYLTNTLLYERHVTRRKLRWILFYIWMFSISLALPTVVDLFKTPWPVLVWNEPETKGTELCKLTPRLEYSLFIVIVAIFIPAVTVFVINCFIFRVILEKIYLSDMSVIYRPRADSSPAMNQYNIRRPTVHFDELHKITSSVDPSRYEERLSPTATEARLNQGETDLDFEADTSVSNLSLGNGGSVREMSSTSVDLRRIPDASTTSSSPLKLSAFSARLLSPIEQSGYMKSLDMLYIVRNKWATRISTRSMAYCEMKAGLSLFVIVTVYVVCWVPFGIISVLDVLDPKLKYSLTREVFLWLAYSNSCWNPIIYSLMNTNFRNGLFKCLRTSIRNTRYVSRICYKKKPVVLKRKKSDSHRTPSSFMLPLKSGTHENDTHEKVKDPSIKQTDNVTL